MRTLLDYSRTGRWLTLNAEEVRAADTGTDTRTDSETAVDANAQAPGEPQAPQHPGSAIRRLLQFTRTGRWLTLSAPAISAAPPAAPVCADAAARPSAEEQQLIDATFFGVDVREIPAEKWQEIAPLFPR